MLYLAKDMAETFHEHSDSHEHHAAYEPAVTERWKWATVIGNAAIGAAELATGGTSTLSVTADGVHNLGDTATYYIQSEDVLHPEQHDSRRQRLRKASHWIIAVTSAGVGIKAGADLVIDHEAASHAASIYMAGASLALSGALFTQLRYRMRQLERAACTDGEHDLQKHFQVDIMSAVLAVAGAIFHRYAVNAEQLAAIVSGALGVYAFRPTKANLYGHRH